MPFRTFAKFKLSLQYDVLYPAGTCEPGHRSGQVIYPRELMIKMHILKIRHDTKDSEKKVTWILRLSTNFQGEYADTMK